MANKRKGVSMDGEQILHVVPNGKDGGHWLYTDNGWIVLISPHDGHVIRAAQLPSEDEIADVHLSRAGKT